MRGVGSPWSNLPDGSFVHSYKPFRGKGVPIYLIYDPTIVEKVGVEIRLSNNAVELLIGRKYKPAFILTDATELLGLVNKAPTIVMYNHSLKMFSVVTLALGPLYQARTSNVSYALKLEEILTQDILSNPASSDMAALLNSCFGVINNE